MEFYKKLRNIAALTLVTAMPYVCNSCDYSDKQAKGADIATIQQSEQIAKNLELILDSK